MIYTFCVWRGMRVFLGLLVLLFLSSNVLALNTQSLRYYFPHSKSLSLIESIPRPADTLSLGFGFNYARQPLEFGTTGGGRAQGIVDYILTFDFLGSFSFSDRFSMGIDLPAHIGNNVTSINATTQESPMNLGDILLSGLYNVLPPQDNRYHFGFSVVPFVSFPSGRSSDFVGDAHMTGGVLFVGDINLEGHYLGLNLGFRARQTENFINLSVASDFLYTLGYHHVLVTQVNLNGWVEVAGSTVFKDFWQKQNASPIELRYGLSMPFLDNRLQATLANGLGVGRGYGNPDYRVALKLAYDHRLPKSGGVVKVFKPAVSKRLENIEKELKELTIYYPTDGSTVDPFYDQKIAGIAAILTDNSDLGVLYIVAYTDDVGSESYNQKLSERRAKRAREAIVAHGLSSVRVVSLGLGEGNPVVPNTSDANRALNRRTLFTFVKPRELEQGNEEGKIIGYNTLTGKKNDSYTEVLKELEQKKQLTDDQTVIIKKFKDSSEVIADPQGVTQTKDSPTAEPKIIPLKPRSKKFYQKTEPQIEKDILYEDEQTFEEF